MHRKPYITPLDRHVTFTDYKILSSMVSNFIELLFDDRLEFFYWRKG